MWITVMFLNFAIMKHLTLLWGIIILLLACVPCTDSVAAVDAAGSSLVQEGEEHSDPLGDSDLCSPLCECNCCGGITLAFFLPKLAVQPHTPLVSYSSTYTLGGPVSPDFSFWHPPKA